MGHAIRILLFFTLALCACAGPRYVPARGPDPEVMSLVEAERAFARMSSEKGVRDAFLEHSAADAVIFRPHPVNARKWYMENPDITGVLSWEPAYIEVSHSNDLGYTTGPWEFRERAEDTEAASYGHYVSVWRKEPGGSWRLVADMGNVHKRRRKTPSKLSFGPRYGMLPEFASGVDIESERGLLLATDRSFSEESARRGVVVAYMEYSTEDIRFYRINALPVKGKSAVRKALLDVAGTMIWEPTASGVSRAGDLGYTYGTAGLRGGRGGLPETSSYLRIWRKEPGGRWNVALDIALPGGPAPGEDGG